MEMFGLADDTNDLLASSNSSVLCSDCQDLVDVLYVGILACYATIIVAIFLHLACADWLV